MKDINDGADPGVRTITYRSRTALRGEPPFIVELVEVGLAGRRVMVGRHTEVQLRDIVAQGAVILGWQICTDGQNAALPDLGARVARLENQVLDVQWGLKGLSQLREASENRAGEHHRRLEDLDKTLRGLARLLDRAALAAEE